MHHTKRKCDFARIPAEDLPKYLSCLVHLSWAYAGAVWRLKSISACGQFVSLETPVTGNARRLEPTRSATPVDIRKALCVVVAAGGEK